jgi:endonuclease-3 related protein
MYERLMRAYGPQQWWPAATRLEVIVGAYLTQNTSWRGVERSIANLRQAGVLTKAGLRAISEEDLRALIRPSGFMLRKAAALKAFLAALDRDYSGSLAALAREDTHTLRAWLLALPGVGNETADAILLYALGHPVMVVDEYLRRVTTRHALLHEQPRYDEIQSLALAAFHGDAPETLAQHYNEFHAVIVQIGKQYCGPTPKCEACPLGAPEFHPPRTARRSALRRSAAPRPPKS